MGYGGTWVHEVNGDPLSVVIAGGALSINNKQPWALATLSARIEDPGSSITIANDDEWVSTFDGVTVFAGDVNQVIQTDHGRSGPRVYNITAQDYTARLRRSTITGNRDVTESFRNRVLWIMSFDTMGLAADTFIEDIAGTIGPATTDGKTLMEALEEVRSAAGATMYADFDKEVHFFVTESNPAPYDLTSYWNFSLTSNTGEGGVERSGSLTIITPGIQSGMQARVVNDLWGLDEVFDITEVAATVLDPNDDINPDRGGQAEFTVHFGHVIPDTVADIATAVSTITDQVAGLEECCEENTAAPYFCDPAGGDELEYTWVAPADATTFDGSYYADALAMGGSGAGQGNLTIAQYYEDPLGQVLVLPGELESWQVEGDVAFSGGAAPGAGYPQNFKDQFIVGGQGSPSDTGFFGIEMFAPGFSGGPKREEIHWSNEFALFGTLHFRIRRIETSAGVFASQIKYWPLDIAFGYLEPDWTDLPSSPDFGPLQELMFTHEKSGGGFEDDPVVSVSITNLIVRSCAGAAPSSGQVVNDELIGTSDGVTASGATTFPYRPGTLELSVGGLTWEAGGYVETDPATGAWDYTQVPIAGNVVRASYRIV